MATYAAQHYPNGMPIPSKGTDTTYPYPYGYNNNTTFGVSPPETVDPSVVSSGGRTYSYEGSSSAAGASASAGPTGTASSCYRTASASASGVDFNEYMQDRFADTFDPIPLDRSLATQAQTSGALNAKHRELLELQAKAQARLAQSRARFADGLRDAQEVRTNLEWTSKKLT
ncbi:hypothetical protein GGR50DRAFT_503581 [Xylaria sp. CBS 124048]|nr:hypothetical protein GGR50DRAFT_503581 [Xylaria sp. CBS 124048]